MKKIILISLVCIINTNLIAQTNVLDKVIAVVGKNMIKQSELETTYLQQKESFGIIDEPFDIKCEIFESCSQMCSSMREYAKRMSPPPGIVFCGNWSVTPLRGGEVFKLFCLGFP